MRLACYTLQHTATHCDTLHDTGEHCNTLQHTATHCNTLQHTATHRSTQGIAVLRLKMWRWTQHFLGLSLIFLLLTSIQNEVFKYTRIRSLLVNCSWLVTRCNTLQQTVTHCITLYDTATHYNTLQHTATHRNTQGVKCFNWKHGVEESISVGCGGFFDAELPGWIQKQGFEYTRIRSLVVTWCCHSVEPRALTCPFKQSNLSAWSLMSWHPTLAYTPLRLRETLCVFKVVFCSPSQSCRVTRIM